MIIPFPAEKNRESAEKLFSLLEAGHAPFPYNPALPVAPQVEGSLSKAICLYTSGTTGTPKVAVTPVKSHLFSAKGSNALILLRPGDGWLVNLPLYHVSGISILFRCLLSGAQALFADDDPARVTHISCVPAQLGELGRYPNLRVVLLGGSAAPKVDLPGVQVIRTYGMTEMCSQIASEIDGKGMQVLPYRRVQIVDGEIWVGGETLFSGYLGESVDEWFPTGDLGYFEKGRLFVTGRKDRMFISGGENIQPAEIEEALLAIEGVKSARVVPQKDERFGARPVAHLVTTKIFEEEELRTILAKSLVSWKIPLLLLQNVE